MPAKQASKYYSLPPPREGPKGCSWVRPQVLVTGHSLPQLQLEDQQLDAPKMNRTELITKRPLDRAKNSFPCFRRILTMEAHTYNSISRKRKIDGAENRISLIGTRTPRDSPQPHNPQPTQIPHLPTCFLLQSYKLCLDLKTQSHHPRGHVHDLTGFILGPKVRPWIRRPR